MADEEEVVIRATLEDHMSRGMAQLQAEVRELSAAVKEANVAQVASTNAVTAAINKQTTAIENAARKRSDLDRMFASWSRMEAPINRATAAALNFSKAFSIGVAGSAAAASAAIVGFGLKSAATIQNLQLSLQALTGSNSAGTALFSQLQNLANFTPFSTQQQVQSAQMLLNYGVQQSQIIPLERSLSDITSATPDPQGNLSQISLALGQVGGKGVLRGQEFNQLANAGVPIAKIVSEAYGIPLNQVQNMMQTQDLPADKLISAITNMNVPSLQNLKGFSARSSQTLGGVYSTFTSQLQQASATAMGPAAVSLSKQLPGFGEDLARTMTQAAPGLDHLFSATLQFVDHALPLLGPILNSVTNGMGGFIDKLIPWLDREAASGRITSDMDRLSAAFIEMAPYIGPLAGEFADFSTNLMSLGVGSLPLVLPLFTDLLTFANALAQSGPLGRAGMDALIFGLVFFKTVSPIIYGIKGVAAALDMLTISESAAGAAGGAGLLSRLSLLGKVGLGAGLGLGGAVVLANGVQDDGAGGFLKSVGGGAGVGAAFGLAGGPFAELSVPAGAAIGAVGGGLVWGGKQIFGDVSDTFSNTLSAHSRAAAGLPGTRITSGMRNWGLAGAMSGHARGTALDVTGPFVRSYIDRVRNSGGYGVMHDTGSGMHGHAQWGDSIPPAGGGGWQGGGYGGAPVAFINVENVNTPMDISSAVRQGMREAMRDQAERK